MGSPYCPVASVLGAVRFEDRDTEGWAAGRGSWRSACVDAMVGSVRHGRYLLIVLVPEAFTLLFALKFGASGRGLVVITTIAAAGTGAAFGAFVCCEAVLSAARGTRYGSDAARRVLFAATLLAWIGVLPLCYGLGTSSDGPIWTLCSVAYLCLAVVAAETMRREHQKDRLSGTPTRPDRSAVQ